MDEIIQEAKSHSSDSDENHADSDTSSGTVGGDTSGSDDKTAGEVVDDSSDSSNVNDHVNAGFDSSALVSDEVITALKNKLPDQMQVIDQMTPLLKTMTYDQAMDQLTNFGVPESLLDEVIQDVYTESHSSDDDESHSDS